MSGRQRLLVVDDEGVICQACRRIFSPQGFLVEESTDAREGLSRAMAGDYDGILLDIKMPEMDGIEFLEELRKQKPDIPVMIMTGYPSVPNAAAAIRLGASDYVTKPFTPEEITQCVQRMLARRDALATWQNASASSAESPGWAVGESQRLFLNESWVQPEADGSACVGAVPAPAQAAAARAVRLPRIGEVVYQGLPLAGLQLANDCLMILPSPVSGVVVSVNERLNDDPRLLGDDPCGEGWIACVCTTRLDEEIDHCTCRRVILANCDEASADRQSQRLQFLGCEVLVAKDWETLAPAVRDPHYVLLVFDATSFGQAGPELVHRVNAASPSKRILVVASSTSRWEAAYRERRIFYYAVEPFADNEIVEILDAAFRPRIQPCRPTPHWTASPQSVSSISITNRNRTKVCLLAAPGLLKRDEGLGLQIKRKLDERMFPMVTTPGEREITPADILKTASGCDRVMVLTVKDAGRLPGSLVRNTKPDFVVAAGEKAGKVTTLTVQPDAGSSDLAGLDDRTTAALAEHIVQEMGSY